MYPVHEAEYSPLYARSKYHTQVANMSLDEILDFEAVISSVIVCSAIMRIGTGFEIELLCAVSVPAGTTLQVGLLYWGMDLVHAFGSDLVTDKRQDRQEDTCG